VLFLSIGTYAIACTKKGSPGYEPRERTTFSSLYINKKEKQNGAYIGGPRSLFAFSFFINGLMASFSIRYSITSAFVNSFFRHGRVHCVGLVFALRIDEFFPRVPGAGEVLMPGSSKTTG
jgi:hypothetical protein